MSSKASMINRLEFCSKIFPKNQTTWLDIGCGTGEIFKISRLNTKKYSKIVGIDKSRINLNIAKKNY